MNQKKSYPLVVSGLMVALGILLPYFTSHMFSLPGTLLLPMHLPILICGLLCGPAYGTACGLLVPVLSSILTSMPPVFPMLPIMAVQLMVLGAVGGLLYRRLRLPLYLSLPGAILAGWASYGLVYHALLLMGGNLSRALPMAAAVMKGIPGLLIQLGLVPVIVKALDKSFQAPQPAPKKDDAAVEQAKKMILDETISFAVIREGDTIHTGKGKGISPILELYRDNPDKIMGSMIVDKIIGKAAAMLLVHAGATGIYGEVMSVAARDYLAQKDILASYGRCVDVITARDGTGICPIERSVLDIDDPVEGYHIICQTLGELQNGSPDKKAL